MKSFAYRTTSKARVLEMVARIRRAGYTFQKASATSGKPLPAMTFSTSTYTSSGPMRVYSVTWAYGPKAPLPPRRKVGRGICAECGAGRVHAYGLCARCRERQRYRTDPEYRARVLARSRETSARLYRSNPEWKARRRKYQAEWARRKRAAA